MPCDNIYSGTKKVRKAGWVQSKKIMPIKAAYHPFNLGNISGASYRDIQSRHWREGLQK